MSIDPFRLDRDRTARLADALAARGAWVGASSWKYAGWRGQLYAADRYTFRGRFSEARFNRLCLAEYAEVFPTVCVDAAYYKFPDRRYLEGLVSQVPSRFRFAFKVTDEITIRRFTNLPRFGPRAGRPNPDFLNAERFASAFLAPCEPFRSQVGLLIFEFARFHAADFARGRDFVEALDGFLARLPADWPYGVEIRNRAFLQPLYFDTLRRHGVAHVFNSWEAMPPLPKQIALPGSRTHPLRCGARLLLRPGRRYEEAVEAFKPYDRIRDPNPEGRAAAAALIRERLAAGSQGSTYLYFNNRFEGSALGTIQAVLDAVADDLPRSPGSTGAADNGSLSPC